MESERRIIRRMPNKDTLEEYINGMHEPTGVVFDINKGEFLRNDGKESENGALSLILQERRKAIQASVDKDVVKLTSHIQRYEIMEEFALKLGLIDKPINKLDPNP